MPIELLDNLINDNYKVRKNNEGCYILEEKSAKTFPKTQLKTSGKFLLYKFDDDKTLLHFFKDIEGAKSISDYVCFMIYKDSLFIYIIELSTKKYKTYQKITTKLFIDFIIKTCERLNKKKFQLTYKNLLITKIQQEITTKLHYKDNYFHKAGKDIKLLNYCLM